MALFVSGVRVVLRGDRGREVGRGVVATLVPVSIK